MEINERITHLIASLEMNANSFADAIGVKSAVVYNIVKGRRSKPSFEVLQKILLSYQTLNANWLINGEGVIWKDGQVGQDSQPGYIRIEQRLDKLIEQLRAELGDRPELAEMEELVRSLLEENVEQKFKIVSLYEKQDQILDVIRKKLSIDI